MDKVEPFVLPQFSPRIAEKVLALGIVRDFKEGEFVFHAGDPALNLYIVIKGEVALEIHVPPKGTTTLTTVEDGDWFSWSAVLEPRIETASARAVRPTQALAIRGGALMDASVEDPELGFQLCRALAQVISMRLTETRLQMLDMYAPH